MKNLFFVLLSCLVLLSCSENDNFVSEVESDVILEKSQIVDASLEEQIKYKRHHMKIISKWIANYGVELINFQKKDEDEFLVADLVDKAIRQKKFSKDNENFNDVILSLDAFKEIGSESWHPIVRKLESNLLYKSTEPQIIISIEDADLNGEKFTHYLPGENDDDLVEVDFEVTPQTTQNFDMLVAELFPVDGGGNADTGGDFGGGGGFTKLELDNMKIKDLKEGWPGRSEIAFKGYKIDVQPNIGYSCGEDI